MTPTRESYDGPIFDIQTHAIMPETLSRAREAIMSNESLTTPTKEVMAHDVCINLADNLNGALRQKALDKGTIHVVSVNTFFPLPTCLAASFDMRSGERLDGGGDSKQV